MEGFSAVEIFVVAKGLESHLNRSSYNGGEEWTARKGRVAGEEQTAGEETAGEKGTASTGLGLGLGFVIRVGAMAGEESGEKSTEDSA